MRQTSEFGPIQLWCSEIANCDYEHVARQILVIAGDLEKKYLERNQVGQDLQQLGEFFIDVFKDHKYVKGSVRQQIAQMKTWLDEVDSGNSGNPELNCVPLSLVFMEFTKRFEYNPTIFGRSGDSHLLLAYPNENNYYTTVEFVFPEENRSRVNLPPLSLKTEPISANVDEVIRRGQGILSQVLYPMPNYSLSDMVRIYDSFLRIKDFFMMQFKAGMASEIKQSYNHHRIILQVELVEWLKQTNPESLNSGYWSMLMKEQDDNLYMYNLLKTN